MRFRGAIYVDIDASSHEEAKEELRRLSMEVPDSYCGGVAEFRDNDILGNLERMRVI